MKFIPSRLPSRPLPFRGLCFFGTATASLNESRYDHCPDAWRMRLNHDDPDRVPNVQVRGYHMIRELIFGTLVIVAAKAIGEPALIPTAQTMIDRLNQSILNLQKQQIVSESIIQTTDSVQGTRYRHIGAEYTSDGERALLSKHDWQKNDAGDPEDAKTAVVRAYLWDGDAWYEYHQPAGLPDAAWITTSRGASAKDIARKSLPRARNDESLDGWLDGDDVALPVILGRNSLTVRKATEKIGDSECYVIDVEGQDGQYTVWLDPEHGFLTKKAQVTKQGQDSYYGAPIDTPPKPSDIGAKGLHIKRFSFTMTVDSFSHQDDNWVPESGVMDSVTELDAGRTFKQHHVCHRTSIKLGDIPDSVFIPHFPNGVRVFFAGDPAGVHWTWQDGKPTTQSAEAAKESVDRIVREMNKRKEQP